MLLTFSTDSLSPHYDPDDGPVIVSAAYRAEVRAFLLGEPLPVAPPPVPIPCPDPCPVSRPDVYQYHDVPAASPVPPAPTSTHRPPTSWYSIADGWHDCPPPKFPLILFDYSRPDEFDPNPVLADFVYHARDFADCPKKNFPAPDWVQIFLVDSDGNWSDSYVPIDGLPPEHITLIDSARSAWNAQRANANSPSPLTERRPGGEVLPATTTPPPFNETSPSPTSWDAESPGDTQRVWSSGSGGEGSSFLTGLFNLPDTFLFDLTPYLSDLLTARPHLLEALSALRAARSERARCAAITRRANRQLIPVGTPFLASVFNTFASIPSTYPISSPIPPAAFAFITPSPPNATPTVPDRRGHGLPDPSAGWLEPLFSRRIM